MDIHGKVIVFVRDFKNKDGSIKKLCSTSVGSKDKDGKYVNYNMDVRFAGSQFPPETLEKLKDGFAYTLDVTVGFLSAKATQKRGTVIDLVITAATVKEAKPYNKETAKQDALPF